jgi:hypothetical protein
MDLNLDGIPVVIQDDMRLVPVVAVRQNVYPVKGKGLAVHGGKTATALRIVPPRSWSPPGCEHGVMVTRTQNGRCLLPPAGMGNRPIGGRRMCGAACGQCVSRWVWGG